jgi:hypothetical protein
VIVEVAGGGEVLEGLDQRRGRVRHLAPLDTIARGRARHVEAAGGQVTPGVGRGAVKAAVVLVLGEVDDLVVGAVSRTRA